MTLILGVIGMPDGDVVYHGVGRGYAGAYKELCEGYFNDEHVAGKIANALRKSLKRYGNQPITLVTQTFSDVSDAVARGVSIDATQESYQIDQTARELMGHRRGTPLAIDACKEYVMQVRDDMSPQPTAVTVIKNYVIRVLDADFFQHLPLLSHHNNTDPQMVEERLQQIRPYLDAEVERMVAQIAKSGRVDRLRKQAREQGGMPDFSNMDIAVPESWEAAVDG
jgi:hypothetical protein